MPRREGLQGEVTSGNQLPTYQAYGAGAWLPDLRGVRTPFKYGQTYAAQAQDGYMEELDQSFVRTSTSLTYTLWLPMSKLNGLRYHPAIRSLTLSRTHRVVYVGTHVLARPIQVEALMTSSKRVQRGFDAGERTRQPTLAVMAFKRSACPPGLACSISRGPSAKICREDQHACAARESRLEMRNLSHQEQPRRSRGDHATPRTRSATVHRPGTGWVPTLATLPHTRPATDAKAIKLRTLSSVGLKIQNVQPPRLNIGGEARPRNGTLFSAAIGMMGINKTPNENTVKI